MSDQERLDRERAFHDERFAGGDDRSSNRFYVIDRASVAWYEAQLDAVPAGAEVLDYGCGADAKATLRLAARGARVSAFDLSPVAIEEATAAVAAAGLADRVELRVMDAEHLEYPDGRFDVVVGTGVLHHLDLERAYSEIARVLRPGGTAVFVEPLGHNPLINWYRDRTPEDRTPDEHPILHADLELAKRWFADVDARSFHLLSLLALPFAKRARFERIVDRLDGADRLLFKAIPRARRFGWMVGMRMTRAA